MYITRVQTTKTNWVTKDEGCSLIDFSIKLHQKPNWKLFRFEHLDCEKFLMRWINQYNVILQKYDNTNFAKPAMIKAHLCL